MKVARKAKKIVNKSIKRHGLAQANVVVDMTHKLNAVCRSMDAALSSGIEVTFALDTGIDGSMFIKTLTVAKRR